MSPIDQLKSVLCGPEGKCCISGSDDDRHLIDSALAELAQATAAPAQPVAEPANGTAYAELPDRQELIDVITRGLHDTYHCTRVWEAWNVGTMTEEDFGPVGDSDTPAELADAVLSILASHGQAPATKQVREVSDAMVLAALQMQHPAAYGQYLRHPANGPKTSIRTEAEIDTARRMIAAALAAAPQPSPTAQSADSVPAVSDLPPLPAPDLRDVGTKPQEIKEFLKGYATEYARTAIAARAPADSVQEDAARLD